MLKKTLQIVCVLACIVMQISPLQAQKKVKSYFISGKIAFPKNPDFMNDRKIYLLNERGDTVKKTVMTYGDNKRFFLIDSIRLSNSYTIFVKKDSYSKPDEIALLSDKNKKLANFTITDKGYYCKIDSSLKKYLFSRHNWAMPNPDLIDIEAKLLYGPGKNKPLKNHKVFLTDAKGDTLKHTTTNQYGDFEFRHIKKQPLDIKVESTPSIKNEKEIYVAKQNGVIISTIKKEGASFTFKMLEADEAKLAPINEEDDDTELKLDAFSKSSNQTITVAQNIYYPLGEYKVDADAALQLDIIAEQLKKNPGYKLEITSHTDAQGDDAFNMDLSKKRANAVLEYLESKGISPGRLKATGLGETRILNRCGNNVKCSETEHELNRRTEFKFIK